mmetsp:Transcript_45078/g.94528  ORF Transcript_45078/g.94528 Transcript_45078/m.94528 type:complete len:100 (+) Transcript_45078:786-1085(+)
MLLVATFVSESAVDASSFSGVGGVDGGSAISRTCLMRRYLHGFRVHKYPKQKWPCWMNNNIDSETTTRVKKILESIDLNGHIPCGGRRAMNAVALTRYF